MSNLQSALSDLASNFASQVLEAIRGASVQELFGGGGGGGNRRTAPAAAVSSPPKARRSSGRLVRRSADDIAKALDQVVGLVKKSKDGLRAEQIRAGLGMEAKEMPRILQAGLASKVLKSKGQKRATTYFAK